jgi:membrane-anchored protein YejM (alkaline phosphatase superfamily)
MNSPSSTTAKAARIALGRLTVLNLIIIWLNAAGYLQFAKTDAGGLEPFVWVTFFVHFLIVNTVLFGILWAAAKALPRFVVLGLAPFLFGFQNFFYLLDQQIYALFNFHVNGLVLQVIMQPDAAKVLGINATEITWAVTAAALILGLEYLAAYVLYRTAKPAATTGFRWRTVAAGFAALVVVAACDKVAYGVYAFQGNRVVLAQARVIPFYVPVSMNKILGKVLKTNPYASGTVSERVGSYLNYPKNSLTFTPGAPTPNIFWINVESWRADSISPERTPRLWEYREKFIRAQQHFSGGNATRLGMFSLFYGLNPHYWDTFLSERRGPVFFDVLHEKGYELDVLSSASLNFLGTRDTVFRQVKSVRQEFYYRPEISDVIMLRKALKSLDERDPAKPLFQFQFFDTTHAKYRFLPGFAPFEPYIKDINGLDKDASAKRDLVLNRYWNSVYYMDFLVGRYLDGLQARGLLDDAIIVITGDHGEEFWEHGHFTHSSAFTDEQLRVPLWLHLPGEAGREITRLTSHMDVVPTVLGALGVQNPASDYSQGYPLLGAEERPYAIASGWGNYAVIDADTKLSFYATNFSFSLSAVTDREDNPLGTSNAEVFRQKGPRMMEVFNQFGDFLAKSGPAE